MIKQNTANSFNKSIIALLTIVDHELQKQSAMKIFLSTSLSIGHRIFFQDSRSGWDPRLFSQRASNPVPPDRYTPASELFSCTRSRVRRIAVRRSDKRDQIFHDEFYRVALSIRHRECFPAKWKDECCRLRRG